MGIVFGPLVASHTFSHICDFQRFSVADEADIFAVFGDKLDPPQSPAGRWGYMLSTRAGITGIIMVLCLIVAYSFAFNRREQFNRFWYTHQLLLVMLIVCAFMGREISLSRFKACTGSLVRWLCTQCRGC